MVALVQPLTLLRSCLKVVLDDHVHFVSSYSRLPLELVDEIYFALHRLKYRNVTDHINTSIDFADSYREGWLQKIDPIQRGFHGSSTAEWMTLENTGIFCESCKRYIPGNNHKYNTNALRDEDVLIYIPNPLCGLCTGYKVR